MGTIDITSPCIASIANVPADEAIHNSETPSENMDIFIEAALSIKG